jgi:hypothetical protein
VHSSEHDKAVSIHSLAPLCPIPSPCRLYILPTFGGLARCKGDALGKRGMLSWPKRSHSALHKASMVGDHSEGRTVDALSWRTSQGTSSPCKERWLPTRVPIIAGCLSQHRDGDPHKFLLPCERPRSKTRHQDTQAVLDLTFDLPLSFQ